jgi:hypothetical protein
MIQLKIEHLFYTILLEDFILILGAELSPSIVPYITPHLFPLFTTGAIMACYAFSILLILEALKQVIFYLIRPETIDALLKHPYLMWVIDGLSIMASQIGGIYKASILLKEAFLPLLFCSFMGSMAVLQTAMIGVFFFLEAKEYLKKQPKTDNRIAFMEI